MKLADATAITECIVSKCILLSSHQTPETVTSTHKCGTIQRICMWKKKIVIKWLEIGRKNTSCNVKLKTKVNEIVCQAYNYLVTCADSGPNILNIFCSPGCHCTLKNKYKFSFGNSYMCHLLTTNMGPYSKIRYKAKYTYSPYDFNFGIPEVYSVY